MINTLNLKNFPTRAALVLLGGVLGMGLPGSVTGNRAFAQTDVSQLMTRIERLERDLRDLRAQVYRGGPPPAGAASAPSTGAGPSPEMLLRADQVDEQIRSLTGKLEELQFAADQNAQRLDRLAKDVEFRLQAIEGGHGGAGSAAGTNAGPAAGIGGTASVNPAPAPAGPAQAPGDPFRSPPAGVLGTMPAGQPSALPPAMPAQAPPAPAASGVLPAGSPQEQYNYAFGLIRQGDYAGAETAFKEFIARNPKSELAGNADYWLGRGYYVRGNYQAAATAFLDTIQTYSNSPKAPEAMLGLGMSLALLNQKTEACQTFKALPAKYPKADGAVKESAKQEAKRAKCP